MNKVIGLIGLPRSGKTSWAQQWLEAKWGPEPFTRIVVSRDAVRLALYGERFRAEREKDVHFIYSNMVKSLLLNPYNKICMDETNCSVKSIRGILQNYDINAEFVFINTPPEICKERAILSEQSDLIEVIPRMWKGLLDLGHYCGIGMIDFGGLKHVLPSLAECVYKSIEKIREEVKNGSRLD